MKNRLSEVLAVAAVVLLFGVVIGARLQLNSYEEYKMLGKAGEIVLRRLVVNTPGSTFSGNPNGWGSEGSLTKHPDFKILDGFKSDNRKLVAPKRLFFLSKKKAVVVVRIVPVLFHAKHYLGKDLEDDAIEVVYPLTRVISKIDKNFLNDLPSDKALEEKIMAILEEDELLKAERDGVLEHFRKVKRKYDDSDLASVEAEMEEFRKQKLKSKK